MLTFSFLNFSAKFKRRFLPLLQSLKKPKWFIMFCLGRINRIRSFATTIQRQPGQLNLSEEPSIFKNLNADKVVENLSKEGLYCGINLPQNLLKDILKFSNSATYIGNDNPKYCFHLHNRRQEELKHKVNFVSGHHLNPSLLCPAIKTIETDPKLWKIAANYLRTKPIPIGSQIRWSFVTQENLIPEHSKGFFRFHYDLEDYCFIKFIFYLTDVDLTSGPHVCVKGSHKKKRLRHQFSLIRETNDKEIVNYYGEENVKTICGKAGFGFVEDLYCFHKLAVPICKDRLILEVKFAMNSYGLS